MSHGKVNVLTACQHCMSALYIVRQHRADECGKNSKPILKIYIEENIKPKKILIKTFYLTPSPDPSSLKCTLQYSGFKWSDKNCKCFFTATDIHTPVESCEQLSAMFFAWSVEWCKTVSMIFCRMLREDGWTLYISWLRIYDVLHKINSTANSPPVYS